MAHKRTKERKDYDTPWSNILGNFFEQFMAFCWPDKYHLIDWKRGYTSLDKDLKKITKDAKVGNRVVDKLIKLYTICGEEKIIYIHIEVQGRSEKYFGERIYVYNYRLFDKFRQPIVSVVILTDKNPHWRPNSYRSSIWDCSCELNFKVVKLLDYKKRKEELEASENPFAMVILAQLAALEIKEPEQKMNFKINLARRLYKKRWKKQNMIDLFLFIDWIVALPQDFEIEYDELLLKLEGEMSKNFVNRFELKGVEKGRLELIKRLLLVKFKSIPKKYQEMLEEADSKELLIWGDRLVKNDTLEEIFSS